MTPGWKTTEFYVAGLIPQILGILVLTGVIGPEQQALVQDGVEVAVASGTELWGALIGVAGAFGYAVSRGLSKFGK